MDESPFANERKSLNGTIQPKSMFQVVAAVHIVFANINATQYVKMAFGVTKAIDLLLWHLNVRSFVLAQTLVQSAVGREPLRGRMIQETPDLHSSPKKRPADMCRLHKPLLE